MSVETNIRIGGFLYMSAQDSLTAHAGGGQTSAFQLTAMVNRVTTVATAADSVMLPPSPTLDQGMLCITVVNSGTNAMQVFGQPGDTVDGVASTTGVSQMPNSVVQYTSTTPGKWFTDGLAMGFSGSLVTESSSNALTAFATGGQASATQLPSMYNRVTTVATAGDSVKLPVSAAGLAIVVVNSGAAAMDVFPSTGDAINNLAVNTAYRQPTNSTAVFVCNVAGVWNMQVPVPAAKYTKNTTAGATVAAAGDLTGAAYTQAEYSAVGAANLTTRTAALMIADGFLQVGDSYVLEITNTSAGTTTLVAGTGVTLTGTMTMATNSIRRFNVKVTAAATITIQSTGVGTIS